MEQLGQEIFRVGYRLVAAFLMVFLVISFWASAPGPDPAAVPSGPDHELTTAAVPAVTPTQRLLGRLGDLAGVMWHWRSAWLRLYERAGSPPLRAGTLTPAEGRQAIRAIGLTAAVFFGIAFGARWAGQRLIQRGKIL